MNQDNLTPFHHKGHAWRQSGGVQAVTLLLDNETSITEIVRNARANQTVVAAYLA